MKWTLFASKVGLSLGLGACIATSYAANTFFKVTFLKKDQSNQGYLSIVTKTPNKTYSSAGIKVNTPHYTISQIGSDCTMKTNGWCLFSANDKKPKVFNISMLDSGLSKANESVKTSAKVTIQLALNAQNTPTSIQNINVSAEEPGRIIGYLYGWEAPPTATAIASAGYTHVLIAFGLFSTTSPGTINIDSISGFDLSSYVASLHAQGIKVLLSIGGASTSIPNTTVNFDSAVSLASSPGAFEDTFLTSMESLVTTYGFDGFDFDIEAGLNGANSFTNPNCGCSSSSYSSQCDISYLTYIINTFSLRYPNSELSLAPQIANISATSSFNATWGNYASLIMQTYSSLEWVGFQDYNAGCAYGINLVCYPTDGNTLTSTADAAVAFATDLLASWPPITESGQATGFLPYTSYLVPSQVVLGYTVNNVSGSSDGSPAAITSVVQNAIQCLRSAEYCDTYTPPTTYPGIGGVFSWTINYDASNNYQFATSLFPCVIQGNCT